MRKAAEGSQSQATHGLITHGEGVRSSWVLWRETLGVSAVYSVDSSVNLDKLFKILSLSFHMCKMRTVL